jgi:DNA-directed RNA polymerase specialized sigma24 family protein
MALSETDRVYDALLVTLVRAGDARAAERLAVRWQPRLLRAARRMLGDGEEAREAVQEAWGGICRGWLRLSDPEMFPAWAYGILSRKCADRIRGQSARRARFVSAEAAPEPSEAARGAAAPRDSGRARPAERRAPDRRHSLFQRRADPRRNRRCHGRSRGHGQIAPLSCAPTPEGPSGRRPDMTNFETRLKESLTAEDEAFLRNLEEGESLFGQLGSTFSGPMKFWTGFAFALSFAFFGSRRLGRLPDVWGDRAADDGVLAGRVPVCDDRRRPAQDLVLDAHEPSRPAARVEADRTAACALNSRSIKYRAAPRLLGRIEAAGRNPACGGAACFAMAEFALINPPETPRSDPAWKRVDGSSGADASVVSCRSDMGGCSRSSGLRNLPRESARPAGSRAPRGERHRPWVRAPSEESYWIGE